MRSRTLSSERPRFLTRIVTRLSQRRLIGLHRLAKGNCGLLGAVLIEEVAANHNKEYGDDSDTDADK